MKKLEDQAVQAQVSKALESNQGKEHKIAQEYTEKEASVLQSLLDRQLGPEYISYRPGVNGSKVHYLEAWKVINLANEVFGFNGWSSSIQNIQVDYIDEFKESGRLNLGVSVIVRVTLKNGIYHEDIGYGCVENFRGKGAAFEKAKKEGTTDALKRALRTFGNVLGNCLYDKTYLREIGKINVTKNKFDVSELHRHPSAFNKIPNNVAKPIESKETLIVAQPEKNIPSKEVPTLTRESELYEDGDEFDDIDFQEIDKPIDPEFCHQFEYDIEDTFSNFSHSDLIDDNVHVAEEYHTTSANLSKNGRFEQKSTTNTSHNFTDSLQKKETEKESKPYSLNEPPKLPQNPTSIKQNTDHPPDYIPMFVNTRSAITNSKGVIDASSGVAFNPHIDSPSLRKTPGLDHTKSTPIRRQNTPINMAPLISNRTKQPPTSRLVGAPPTHTRNYHQDPFQSTSTKRFANNNTSRNDSSFVLNEMPDPVLNQQESFQKENDKNDIHNSDTINSIASKRYKT
ncbi:hypothetical protein T552_02521 [Pneumocystis carinii B80]|uniref:DNA repair and recombination protein RAD52 n=1 Tax=Pneumocystis carinii (strain B80) TaxID=1408658 RepID=A0A0W4ZF71_PNEC8|nr:hypothetical protein T552_02521 [Pneumocystis carinii B80]KTW27028.1 hypothetical protein T552_02521 [Pneumocystis carinii B80]